MSAEAIRVLIIDDSELDRELVRRQLMRCEAAAFVVATADSARAGMEAIEQLEPDVVLLDHGMPVDDGFTVLRALEGRQGPPVIFLTGREDDGIIQEALRLGARRHAPKSMLTTPAICDVCIEVYASTRSVGISPRAG
jgi:CheY-like chemotaxis protein